MRCVLAVVVFLCVGVPSPLADESAKPSEVQVTKEKTIENSIGMKFVLIPKGTFLMGSPPDEEGREDDEPQHEVTITRDFRLGVYEVTQSQYKRVMGKNPSYFTGDRVAERDPKNGRVVKDVDSANHPVDYVSYDDAVEFCRKLSALPEESAAGRRYRLPTEAEWEYACRSGAKTEFSFGNDAADPGLHAWYSSNSNKMTHAVGGRKPNAFGLYDMHGNVFEWCSDWHDEKYYANSPGTDPKGPDLGSFRVVRGGAWLNVPIYVRCASRLNSTPAARNFFIGIRLVLE